MNRQPHARRTFAIATCCILLIGLAAACHSSTSTSSQSAVSGGTLFAAPSEGGPWSTVFNPYATSPAAWTFGAIYEPLYTYDPVHNAYVPWLATSYKWGKSGTELTFTIRKGVTWSNGQPFTPADVAFTFTMQRKVNALNNTPTPLTSATVRGNTVVLQYKQPQYVKFSRIATATAIVPPFTFDKVKDPLQFQDTHPIGTGPYLLQSVNSQYITYTKNPHFWQKGKPYASTLKLVAADSNSSNEALLLAKKVYFSNVFTSDITKTFVDRDPSHNLLDILPAGTVSMYLNFHQKMFQSLPLRQAINYAIDRTSVSKTGEGGALPPANVAGLSDPLTTPYVLPQYKNPLSQDLGKARTILQQGGYRVIHNRLVDKTGSPVAFSLELPSSFSDWMIDCSIIRQDLGKIGIAMACDGVASQKWTADLNSSKFQATFGFGRNPTAYDEYYGTFYVPANGLPKVGQPNGNVNPEGYNNPAAVRAINQLTTLDPVNTSAYKQQLAILEKIMVEDVPVIPLIQSASEFDFINGPFYGWPTPSNQYMCVFCGGNIEQVLLRLHGK